MRALQQRLLKAPGGHRERVEILALVLPHDEQAVLTAIELAREAGAPTKTHILNVPHRLVDGKPLDAPPVRPPGAPALTTEPQANVERYDVARAKPGRRVMLNNLAAGAIAIMQRSLKMQGMTQAEPPRVYRRPQLLRRWGHDEQDDEQIFA